MDKIRVNDDPEARLQAEIVDKLKTLDWMVEPTHGNIYQFGFPDLYCAHLKYGTRWIEVKNPEKWSFTGAQLRKFPMFAAHGVGIWIAMRVTDVPDMLFKPANYYQFLSAFQVRGRRG